MTQQTIHASPTEVQKLAHRIQEANQAQAVHEHAAGVAADLFTMFCEGHGIPGATFVRIERGEVIVRLPEQKPELVKEA